jgi:hypothetical protein
VVALARFPPQLQGWRRLPRWLWRPLLAAAICLVFAGGVISGWRPQVRLAQPYYTWVYNQRLEPAPLAVARWALANLGPGRTFVADEAAGRDLLAYGSERPLLTRNVGLTIIYHTSDLPAWQLQILQQAQVEYVVFDRRLLGRDNMLGVFLERGTQWPLPPDELVSPGIYTKFNNQAGASRIVDSGDIVIYDVRKLLNAAAQP